MSENNFLNTLESNMSKIETENGAITYSTSKSKLLDYFAQGASMRNASEDRIISLFKEAFQENKELSLKVLFYQRDCRGGSGQKCGFRTIIKWLSNNYPDILRPLVSLIPEYGRWDDLYYLFFTPLEEDAKIIIKLQLIKDYNNLESQKKIGKNFTNKDISLLAKWVKTLSNKSNKLNRKLALKTMDAVYCNPAQYRKMITELREHLDIVERKMVKSEYVNINYENVPSQAMLKYKKAFSRNDEVRFTDFLSKVKNGEAKINTSTLLPCDIVKSYIDQCSSYNSFYGNRELEFRKIDDELELLWNNLPNYLESSCENSLAVIDISGSMMQSNNPMKPLFVAIGLGLYLAQFNNSKEYKNKFITFSQNPSLVDLSNSNTLIEKFQKIFRNENCGYSTNIEKTMDLILQSAIDSKCSQEDFPKSLYIISDMEFDVATSGEALCNKTLFESIGIKFKEHGYQIPKLIFWNVNSKKDNIPIRSNELGLNLVSGYNPSLFKSIMENDIKDPYDFMLSVLNVKRYEQIKIYG